MTALLPHQDMGQVTSPSRAPRKASARARGAVHLTRPTHNPLDVHARKKLLKKQVKIQLVKQEPDVSQGFGEEKSSLQI